MPFSWTRFQMRFVGEMVQSQANRIEQSPSGIGLKFDARAGAVLHVKRFDGIIETTGGADDGDRTYFKL